MAKIATMIDYQAPQTPEDNENLERESVSESVSESDSEFGTSTSTTTTRARAIIEISDYYKRAFGSVAFPPVVERQVKMYLRQGIEPDVIEEAIDEASIAPRPAWAYARAILNRLCTEGVKNMDQYYERQVAFQFRKNR